MKKKCNCGGLQAYAEGGRTRVPTRSIRFIDPEAERIRGRSALEALRGYAGAPSQASVMHPGSREAYESGELAGMAEMLVPGASMAKGALGAALAGVIKPRGGNWIPGDVESSISNLFERLGETDPARLSVLREQMGNPEIGRTGEALGRWIEGPLTKYIKRDMATPEDPIRRLADQGILHLGIPQTIGTPSRGLQMARKLLGFPEGGLSTTPGGSLWENLSDRVINSGPARYLQEEPKMMAENPWMQKLDPESVVYSTPSHIERGLGFDHLIDELNNALNPESGLPRNLLLRPEQLQQMGMEKAVRHVDAINKWRAAQQAAANAELANKALAIREYPDTPELPNPKGLRWVELKAKDVNPPDGYEYDKRTGRYIDPWDEASQPWTPKQDRKAAEEELEKQLKYEGDTMGHCVGGYCPDVLEGNSRIFSLRDAKGEPHVTVEVGKYNAEDLDSYTFAELVGDQERGFKILDEFTDSNMDEFGDFDEFLRKRYPEIASKVPYGHRIKQIKGKQNLAPKDEYLPFVQDFVRNSPLGAGWSRVDDLENTNLVDISGFPKRVEALGSRYVTEKELNDYLDKFGDGNGMADGGMVAQPGYFDDLDAFLRR